MVHFPFVDLAVVDSAIIGDQIHQFLFCLAFFEGGVWIRDLSFNPLSKFSSIDDVDAIVDESVENLVGVVSADFFGHLLPFSLI